MSDQYAAAAIASIIMRDPNANLALLNGASYANQRDDSALSIGLSTVPWPVLLRTPTGEVAQVADVLKTLANVARDSVESGDAAYKELNRRFLAKQEELDKVQEEHRKFMELREDMYASATQNCVRFRNELEAAKKQLKDTRDERDSHLQTVEKVQEELAKAKEKHQRIAVLSEDRYTHAVQECIRLRKELEEAYCATKNHAMELEELNALADKCASSRENIYKDNETIKNLRAELAARADNHKNTEQICIAHSVKVAELEAQLAEVQKQCKVNARHKQILQDDLRYVRQDYITLRRDHDALKEENRRVVQSRDILRTNNGNQRKEAAKWQSKCDMTRNELTRVTNEAREFREWANGRFIEIATTLSRLSRASRDTVCNQQEILRARDVLTTFRALEDAANGAIRARANHQVLIRDTKAHIEECIRDIDTLKATIINDDEKIRDLTEEFQAMQKKVGNLQNDAQTHFLEPVENAITRAGDGKTAHQVELTNAQAQLRELEGRLVEAETGLPNIEQTEELACRVLNLHKEEVKKMATAIVFMCQEIATTAANSSA